MVRQIIRCNYILFVKLVNGHEGNATVEHDYSFAIVIKLLKIPQVKSFYGKTRDIISLYLQAKGDQQPFE